jgi:hypothetical protein
LNHRIIESLKSANRQRPNQTASILVSAKRYADCVPTKIAASQEQPRVGLCVECVHARRIVSERGSVFFLCRLSATDAGFPKYPRLPVLQCHGFEPVPKDQNRE